MASSSRGRARLACDACAVGAWIGPLPAPRGAAGEDGGRESRDAWCEACQRPQRLAAGAAPTCPACGGALTTGEPRFAELWGRLQHLDATLAAWEGDAGALMALLPARPRYLTDLTPPPVRDGDAPPLAEALAAAARGAWSAVLAAGGSDEPRSHAARAIARERLGDPGGALEEWTRALALAEDPRARLARGALHAKAGDWESAAADLRLAGDGREARWNRASLRVHRAVLSTPGRPDAQAIAEARVEAGAAPDYWSEATVGRLAFALLAERTLARRDGGELGDPDLVSLREGEDLLEHSTFWDRALVLAAWARLGPEGAGDAARVAQPLARELAAALLAEPPMRGAALADANAAVAGAWDAIAAFEPRAARAALAPWLAHPALRRYRLPCAACGRGSIGLEAWDDAAGEAEEAAGAGAAVPPV